VRQRDRLRTRLRYAMFAAGGLFLACGVPAMLRAGDGLRDQHQLETIAVGVVVGTVLACCQSRELMAWTLGGLAVGALAGALLGGHEAGIANAAMLLFALACAGALAARLLGAPPPDPGRRPHPARRWGAVAVLVALIALWPWLVPDGPADQAARATAAFYATVLPALALVIVAVRVLARGARRTVAHAAELAGAARDIRRGRPLGTGRREG